MNTNSKNPPVDKSIIRKLYSKSNYRLIGSLAHSAVKPCHWQVQKLLTGRDNRNCYKGYFGIESHLCLQNTPTLPFCNHQCVFCWRDIENGTFGSEWTGDYDSPKEIAREMIRHQKNLVQEHIREDRSLNNLNLMHKILEYYRVNGKTPERLTSGFRDSELSKILDVSRNQIVRAVLLMDNTKVLYRPNENDYTLHPDIVDRLVEAEDVNKLISEFITTEAEIKTAFKEAMNPKHAAISLSGEPTLYPEIGNLVNEFRKRDMSTFIVTNGTRPDVLKKLQADGQLPTQLYVSLIAPNRKKYLQVSRTLIKNGWENLMETMALLPSLPCRTVGRITCVKYVNMTSDLVPEYVNILKEHTPHFIDLKGFTIEASALEMKNRFGGDRELKEYRPTFEDLLEFAQALEKQGGFEIISMHEKSVDILLRGSWPKNKSIKIDYNGPL